MKYYYRKMWWARRSEGEVSLCWEENFMVGYTLDPITHKVEKYEYGSIGGFAQADAVAGKKDWICVEADSIDYMARLCLLSRL